MRYLQTFQSEVAENDHERMDDIATSGNLGNLQLPISTQSHWYKTRNGDSLIGDRPYRKPMLCSFLYFRHPKCFHESSPRFYR